MKFPISPFPHFPTSPLPHFPVFGHKKLTLDREGSEFSQFSYFTVNPGIRLNAL
ncbi:unknown protein [Microcystis aeruginosa NIES-843]|uniref:Uncharacterized protein n=1 Tax=Microcystis aeruginosa (strain NIES-843 / IAM M-2473) TaxID=449447 RepID=B0JJB0_MICAN|nr:unknown protein [Microcystis aeruginosa NIES-843]